MKTRPHMMIKNIKIQKGYDRLFEYKKGEKLDTKILWKESAMILRIKGLVTACFDSVG